MLVTCSNAQLSASRRERSHCTRVSTELPPSRGQGALEVKYREELDAAFGIVFNNLFTITNMPIKVCPTQLCYVE